MKYIILVGDGMGDYPLDALQGRTPLMAARTPAMDHLADHGEIFRLRTVPDGYAPGSDVANLSLAGYRPEKFYTGRSPLEAASMGVNLGADEVAFRCNLVTLEQHGSGEITMVDYCAGHISTAEAAEIMASLQEALNDEIHTFHTGISYRHLLVRKGPLPPLKTVPPHDYTTRDVSTFVKEYQTVPGLSELMERAAKVLAGHPVNQRRMAQGLNAANAIWLWGEGTAPTMPTMQEMYGVNGALISAVDLLKGIGVYAGMEVIEVEGATGYLDTNYEGKVAAALEALKGHDLVFVHVEAPDETAHQGSLEGKIRAIEEFDRKIVQPIVDGAAAYDFRLALTPDHYTPIPKRTHVADPVPLVIYDSINCPKRFAQGYSEASAAKAPLLAHGQEFMEILLGDKR